MSFVGDKGREIYFTFQRGTVQVRSCESAQNINEKDVLQRVVGKFKAHVYNTIQYNSLFTFLFLHINTVKKNPIMAAVKFDRQGLLFLLCLGYIEE